MTAGRGKIPAVSRRSLVVCCLCLAAIAGCGAESNGAPSSNSVTVTLSVDPLKGGAPSSQLIEDTLATLRQRLSAAGIHGTATTDADEIGLSVPATDAERVKALATQVGILRFRQVLEVGKYSSSATTALQPLLSGESPTLSASFKEAFDSWDCSKNPDATNDSDKPDDYVIACDQPGPDASLKYLLAPAAVEGNEVGSASAALDALGKDWQVNLQFTGSGAGDWLRLTRKSYEATGSGNSGFTNCGLPKGCNAVGIVLDGVVESAPAVQEDGIPGGLTEITGDFTETDATDLADVLKYGALPARLTVVT
jgi:preprotein translocase subunit SecD